MRASLLVLFALSLASSACARAGATSGTHFVAVLAQAELDHLDVYRDENGVMRNRDGTPSREYCEAKCGFASKGRPIVGCHRATASEDLVNALSLPSTDLVVCDYP